MRCRYTGPGTERHYVSRKGTERTTNDELRKTSVRQWADPRQAWVLQPDEYQYGVASAEPDTGLLLLREPTTRVRVVWGYGHLCPM
jgi:hypothetical protein